MFQVKSRRFELATLLMASIALLCLFWLSAKVAGGETMQFDTNVRGAIHSFGRPWLTELFGAITLFGSQAAVIGISGCAALTLFLVGRRDRAWLMVIVMAGAELLLSMLKVHFHRPRPEAFFGAPLPGSYSFPSGHALLSLCCYGALAALSGTKWLVRILAAALILAIGVSRVYLGVHYPTDVIGGYLAGIAWLCCLAAIYGRLATMKR
jgi:undecaprenyl-diphosphatase